MDYFLKHAHSGWRWIVLALLITAIITAFNGWKKNAPFEPKHKKIFMFSMIAYHIQFLVGIVLFFVSEKVNSSGEFSKRILMEHAFLMLVGMILITIGYSKSKKAPEDKGKFRSVFIFYLITLLLVLAAIPWPFISRHAWAGYF